MHAEEVLDSYVRDVAAQLPRAQRNDVALELRALLDEELAARAGASGRTPDRALALDLLKSFGRPAEAARRFHERPPLIDPADSHHFAIWAIGGALFLGVHAALSGSAAGHGNGLLEWLGLLALCFIARQHWRLRHPDRLHWRPTHGPDWFPRPLALLALVGTLVFPLFMYAAPKQFVQTIFLGLVYSDGVDLAPAFRDSPLRWVTLLCLVAICLNYLVIALHGGWRDWTRQWGLAVNLLLGLLCLWHATAATVFVSAKANAVAAPTFLGVAALLLLSVLYGAWREWARIRPAPAAPVPAPQPTG